MLNGTVSNVEFGSHQVNLDWKFGSTELPIPNREIQTVTHVNHRTDCVQAGGGLEEAVKQSNELEISENEEMIRGRDNPGRWPLKDEENMALPQNVRNSVLRVDVPDCVPGQRYIMPERNSKRGDKTEVTTSQQEEAAPTTRDSADMKEERLMGLMSLARLLPSSVPEHGGEWLDWQEVERRKGPGTPRDHETSEQSVRESKWKMEKYRKKDAKEVEELDLILDEELEQLDVGRRNNFTEWSDESDDDTEFKDKDIDQLLFITQTPPYLRKHPGAGRTGDYQTRARYISGISKVISERCVCYEQDLWKDNSMQRRNTTIERGEMTFGMGMSVPVPWTAIKERACRSLAFKEEAKIVEVNETGEMRKSCLRSVMKESWTTHHGDCVEGEWPCPEQVKVHQGIMLKWERITQGVEM